MLDYYLPQAGPAFETCLDREDPIGALISAEKMFSFHLEGDGRRVVVDHR